MASTMSTGADTKKITAKKNTMSHEQIVSGFQELRQQQRAVATKITELEMERKEHDLVIETLKEVDSDRKCLRMVGGVLVERTVKEVLPALTANYLQIGKLIETLTQQLETKGKDINEYREKYNIRIRGEEENKPEEKEKDSKPGTQGVLVAKNST